MRNLRSSNILYDTCLSENRADFFLLILTKLKDESVNYLSLQVICNEIHDIIDQHVVPDVPIVTFQENIHCVDEHAKEIIEDFTMIPTNEMVRAQIMGDGDCLFHTLRIFYPTMTVDELRVRCIDELCSYEQYYEAIKDQKGLDLVDDESIQDHVMRIINDYQYTGVV